jgi:hypothetical protein
MVDRDIAEAAEKSENRQSVQTGADNEPTSHTWSERARA